MYVYSHSAVTAVSGFVSEYARQQSTFMIYAYIAGIEGYFVGILPLTNYNTLPSSLLFMN